MGCTAGQGSEYCVHRFRLDRAKMRGSVAKEVALPNVWNLRKTAARPLEVWSAALGDRLPGAVASRGWVKVHRVGVRCPRGWRPMTQATLDEFGR